MGASLSPSCSPSVKSSVMKSWLTEADDYECVLSKDTQRLALEELRETKTARDQALRQMRESIKCNPRIADCRLDSNFLLRFLRAKKFSVILASEALERYLLLRQTMGLAFRKLDALNPNMDDLISRGYMFAVPERDSLGRRTIIARPGVFDPHKYQKEDMCRIHGITYETLLEDEENQVRGFVHFGDGTGVGFPYITLFTPKEAVRIVKNGERTLPMRHKEVHGINVHPSIKFLLDFGMSLVSDKIKKRVRIYTSLEEAMQTVEVNVLPKEYGGTMPMAQMIELWKKELYAARPLLLSHDTMSVREDMYSIQARVGALSALRNGANRCSSSIDSKFQGMTGTFRKLELD